MLDVFLYHDGEERLIATTLDPKIKLHEFAYLRVAALTTFGAFMDIGLENDLFVPWREQSSRLQEGQFAIVFMYCDEKTGRLVGSTRVNRFLSNISLELKEGDEVEAMVWEPTELGLNVIVNQKHKGLIYRNELFTDIKPGDTVTAWVSKIREDNKLDILLQQPGYGKVGPEAERILTMLSDLGGFLPFHDDSSPSEINDKLGMSKKTFKKVVGYLLRRRKIKMAEGGIALVED